MARILLVLFGMFAIVAFPMFGQVNFFPNDVEEETFVLFPKDITDSNKYGPLNFQSRTTIFGQHRDTETKSNYWTSGRWNIHFVFSNGNKVDAEDFVTIVKRFDADNKLIGEPIVVRQTVGASGGGKTKKKTVRMEGFLTADEYQRFHHYSVTHLTTDRDITEQIEEGTAFMKALNDFVAEAVK